MNKLEKIAALAFKRGAHSSRVRITQLCLNLLKGNTTVTSEDVYHMLLGDFESANRPQACVPASCFFPMVSTNLTIYRGFACMCTLKRTVSRFQRFQSLHAGAFLISRRPVVNRHHMTGHGAA